MKQYKKWYFGVVLAIIITLLMDLLSRLPLIEEVELKTLDYRYRTFPIPDQADSNIVLVAIDNSSLDFFSNNGISYPWPRDFFAHALDYFTLSGSKAVIFDMLFYERDLSRSETDPEETDGLFADAIKTNGKVILGMEFIPDTVREPPDLTIFSLSTNKTSPDNYFNYEAVQYPIDTLLNSVRALGVTNINPDRDGIIRHIPLIYQFQNKYYPQLALSGYLVGEGGYHNLIKTNNSYLWIDSLHIPVNDQGNYLINWYGKGGPDGVFKYIPFSAVIQSASAIKSGNKPSLPPQYFKNKYVFLGATGSGLWDLQPTPLSPKALYPGMEIWATILSNIQNETFIIFTPKWVNLLNVFLLSFLTIVIFTKIKGKFSYFVLLILFLIDLTIVLSFWAIFRMLIGVVPQVMGFVLSYSIIASISYIMEGRAKRQIRSVFNRYLHPVVINKLIEKPELFQMGGKEISATIFFTDIYNFTAYSEGQKPPELVNQLNTYFEKLTDIILTHNGLLDKYTGDGVMALFGVPIQRQDHAHLACQVAISHRDFASQMLSLTENSSASMYFHLNTRIGINSGNIVVGNIGSNRRMDYTAIGDNVNLAARLEGVNKIYSTKIIISESTYERVSNEFICRELDYLRVKGKTQPTRIYELLDIKDEKRTEKFNWVEQYHEGLNLYRMGRWNDAVKVFNNIHKNYDFDSVTQVMLDRCLKFQKNPPNNWDGIVTLESK